MRSSILSQIGVAALLISAALLGNQAVPLAQTAPGIDYERFRADLDDVADQDAEPRG